MKLRSFLTAGRLNNLTVHFLKASSVAFTTTVAGQLLRLIELWLLARVCGAAAYGDYVYVLALFQFALLASKLGRDQSAVRFVSEYSVTARFSHYAGFLRWVTVTTLHNSCVLSIAGILAAIALYTRMPISLARTLILAALVIPISALLAISKAVLLAHKDTLKAMLPEHLLQPALMIVLIPLLPLILHDATMAPGAFALFGISTAVALLLSLVWVKPRLGTHQIYAQRAHCTSEWRSVALSLFFVSSMMIIQAESDTVILGSLRGTTEAGIYRTASRLALLPALGFAPINSIMGPIIAQLHAQRNHADLQALVTLCARATTAITTVAVLPVIFLGKRLLATFGPEFTAGYSALFILSIGQTINALCGPVGALMTMTGEHKAATRILFAAAVLNVTLNLLLVPHLGLNGAAAATAISVVLYNVILVTAVWRKHKVWPFAITSPLSTFRSPSNT